MLLTAQQPEQPDDPDHARDAEHGESDQLKGLDGEEHAVLQGDAGGVAAVGGADAVIGENAGRVSRNSTGTT
ncbi:hypothetical protein GCM10017688_55370 [Streptomyces ramulosus]